MTDVKEPKTKKETEKLGDDKPETKVQTVIEMEEQVPPKPVGLKTRRRYKITIDRWKKKVSKIAFVYDYVLDGYIAKMGRSLNALMILGAISALLSTSSLGIPVDRYPAVDYTVKGIMAAITFILTILSAVPKNGRYRDKITDYQEYYDKVDNMRSTLTSHSYLPRELRNDEKFILDNKDLFLEILSNAPNLTQDEFNNALDEYKKTQPDENGIKRKRKRMKQKIMEGKQA